MPRIPFAGRKVDFANRQETMSQVFGDQPIAIGELQKKLWAFIKANNLMRSSP